MGALKKSALIISVFAAVFAYLVHAPIPAEVPNPWYFQLLVDILALSEFLAGNIEKFGFNRWSAYRTVLSLPIPYQVPHGIKIEHQYFADVDCVVVTPRGFQERTEPGPAIVYYHGGGWVFGDLDSYIPLLVNMAKETGFMVMSPEYRRAPEHPFPIPYYDCLNSTISFMRSSKQLNVHPDKIVLAGDSAGGNLAMAVYIGLIQMNDPTLQPAMQALIYPILQMVNYNTPSHIQNAKFMFSRELIPKFWLAYIGLDERPDLAEIVARNGHFDKNDEKFSKIWKLVSDDIPIKFRRMKKYMSMDDTKYELPHDVWDHMKSMMLDTRIAPLLASDDIVKRIKKTLVLVCEYDPLRDDGIFLYQRIKSLNGQAELQYLPNSLHATASLGAVFPNTYYAEQNSMFFMKIKKAIEGDD